MPDKGVVIGVNHYPGHKDLNGSENDATAFHAWLTRVDGGGLATADVKLLLSSHFAPLAAAAPSAKPTSEDVRGAFYPLITEATQSGQAIGDRLFVFFAGHGIGSVSATSAVGFVHSNSEAVYTLATDVLRYVDWFVRKGAFDSVIFIFDCCRVIQPTADPVPPMLPVFVPQGAVVKQFNAYATLYGKVARERPFPPTNVTRGYFTKAFLEALEFAAPNQNGEVTGTGIKDFTHNRIQTFSQNWNDVPVPKIDADSQADVVFCRRATAPLVELRLLIPPAAAGHMLTVHDGGPTATPMGNTPVPAVPPTMTIRLPVGMYKVVLGNKTYPTVQLTGEMDVSL